MRFASSLSRAPARARRAVVPFPQVEARPSAGRRHEAIAAQSRWAADVEPSTATQLQGRDPGDADGGGTPDFADSRMSNHDRQMLQAVAESLLRDLGWSR